MTERMRKAVWRRVGVVAACGVIFVLSGCASIVSGASQDVVVRTSPENARVTVYDSAQMVVLNATTPTRVTLDRGDGFFRGARYRIEIEKDGYRPHSVSITSSINAGWYLLGNIVVGGWIGWLIVDPITGAMWTLRPDTVSTELAEAVGAKPSDGEIFVVLRSAVSDETFAALPLERVQ
ncbi:MAG: hypothetical protein EA426_20110 [Spirochaetaceae bacterium]|nr:MAG: hypothetical protein EA426_20110 [Spirochaetaceae bacterium]